MLRLCRDYVGAKREGAGATLAPCSGARSREHPPPPIINNNYSSYVITHAGVVEIIQIAAPGEGQEKLKVDG
jgi:hypothetical protein